MKKDLQSLDFILIIEGFFVNINRQENNQPFCAMNFLRARTMKEFKLRSSSAAAVCSWS